MSAPLVVALLVSLACRGADRAPVRASPGSDWAQAAVLFESVVSRHDVAPERWDALGAALASEGRPREAIAAYERALTAGVGDRRRLALDIAAAYGLLGDRRQARRWREMAAGPPSATPPRPCREA